MIYIKYPLATFFLFFLLLAIIPSPNVSSQVTFQNDNITRVAVCEEQLQLCVDEFNSLLSDFRNGTNCNSETFNQLKKKNWELTQDRDAYKEEAENLKVYKTSFFIVATLSIIWIILYLLANHRASKNKPRRLTNNGRETGDKRKETRKERKETHGR